MIQYEAIDLPGKILYEKEFNISIRKITPIEQKFILSLAQKEQKTNKDYINFIKKLVIFDNPEMTFEELYWFDLQYILYRIRFSTYAKYPLKLTYKCLGENCNNEDISISLNLGDLIINTPDDIKDLTNTIELTNLGTRKIRNKILRDDLIIDDFIKSHKLPNDDIQLRLLLLDLCIISQDNTLEDMYTLAEQGEITAEDIIGIEEWFNKSVWGVKEEISVKCPKCGKEDSRSYFLALEDFFSAL